MQGEQNVSSNFSQILFPQTGPNLSLQSLGQFCKFSSPSQTLFPQQVGALLQ